MHEFVHRKGLAGLAPIPADQGGSRPGLSGEGDSGRLASWPALIGARSVLGQLGGGAVSDWP